MTSKAMWVLEIGRANYCDTIMFKRFMNVNYLLNRQQCEYLKLVAQDQGCYQEK